MNGYFLVGLEGGNIWNLLPAVNYLQDKVIITLVRDLTSCQYLYFSRTDDMKCKSELFMLAEVFWLGQNKIPSPFLRSRLFGGEGRGRFKTRIMISTVAVTPGCDESSELEVFGHHLQIKTLTAESDVIVVKDHGYGGENRSQ